MTRGIHSLLGAISNGNAFAALVSAILSYNLGFFSFSGWRARLEPDVSAKSCFSGVPAPPSNRKLQIWALLQAGLITSLTYLTVAFTLPAAFCLKLLRGRQPRWEVALQVPS